MSSSDMNEQNILNKWHKTSLLGNVYLMPNTVDVKYKKPSPLAKNLT